MALLCGSASGTFPSSSFPTHKNATTTTKPSFVGFRLPLPKLSLSSSSIGTHLPASFRVRCQQESTSVADDPRFMCVEPEPRFKGPLGRTLFTRLKVYSGPNRPHEAQKPIEYPIRDKRIQLQR